MNPYPPAAAASALGMRLCTVCQLPHRTGATICPPCRRHPHTEATMPAWTGHEDTLYDRPATAQDRALAEAAAGPPIAVEPPCDCDPGCDCARETE